MRRSLLFALALFSACKKDPPPVPRFVAISPRMISNNSDYPVMIYGEHLAEGTVLSIPPNLKLKTTRVDDGHLTALIPAGIDVLDQLPTGNVTAKLIDPSDAPIIGDVRITVANDLDFPTPYALELDDKGVPHVAIKSTDELRDIATGAKTKTCDRPRALAEYRGTLAVLCEEGVIAFGDKKIKVGPDAIDLAIDAAKNVAYVTSHALDRVLAVELESGKVSPLPAGVNPQSIAVAEGGTLLVVGNSQSQDVSIVDTAKKTETRLRPAPGTPIIGGHTERFTKEIMGGTPPRAIAYSDALHVAFVATLGPNIGPNAERMEVSQNGGISVIDARAGKWLRHVSILYGVPEAIALDDQRGVLWVADGSTGRVVALDTKLLAESDASARNAQLAELDLPVPEGVPLIRPEADFGVEKRARIGLHFAAKAIRVSSDGAKVFVLSRSSGEVVAIDAKDVRKKKLSIAERFPDRGFADKQSDRRKGEVVYYSDLGNSRMTCDTCHPEGHSGGIMFSKGRPIRIYRAPTCRAIRESPPYFTPSRLPSIKRTIVDVLARNRFQNPMPTNEEISAATEYTGAIAAPPNPFHAAGGALPAELELPDGARGRPSQGLLLFEGKAGCAEEKCHPPPHFTADQTQATRGVLHKLGTPMALMLRPELQDLANDFGQPPPSLSGVWDQFPLFLSGAGGNEVLSDGTIAATQPFVLRFMLENPAWQNHGHGMSLSAEERNDLLAYLMTL